MANGLDFDTLRELSNYLSGVRRNHVPTMNHYASSDGRGFWHQPTRRNRASLSSTATCVSSLVRAGLWKSKEATWGDARSVAARLLQRPWSSAGLKANNPFGLSFIAEGVLDLAQSEPYEGSEADVKVVTDAIAPKLVAEMLKSSAPFFVPGSISISPYPPSAYLTQLAFRVIKRCYNREPQKYARIVQPVRIWARSEINRQVSYISRKTRLADPLQLGYGIILASSAAAAEQTGPEEKALLREALKVFFSVQQDDGSWASSQPLFHYPDVGNALCFDYELLTQLLSCEELTDELLLYLPQLRIAAMQLQHTSYDLGESGAGRAVGWASGHHPQIEGPESWSTASVYDYVFVLDRLVAEANRRVLFKELQRVYSRPERSAPKDPGLFAPNLLDSSFSYNGETKSLRETVRDSFVVPISKKTRDVATGGSLGKLTPMSAIFYGPPGTSKTQLAGLISQFLGWPLLVVDPSYLVQDGLELLYARANRLFSMLTLSEQIVVLLDEFDEMGRDRAQSEDLLSRFITTSMLPKLAAVNDQRKIVFLLATNYVSQFDAAFSRSGRFDVILPVMQPTLDAKLHNASWEILAQRLDGTGKKRGELERMLADLTYLETQQLVAVLAQQEPGDFEDEVKAAFARCTLERLNGPKDKWRDTLKEDEKTYVRLT